MGKPPSHFPHLFPTLPQTHLAAPGALYLPASFRVVGALAHSGGLRRALATAAALPSPSQMGSEGWACTGGASSSEGGSKGGLRVDALQPWGPWKVRGAGGLRMSTWVFGVGQGVGPGVGWAG